MLMIQLPDTPTHRSLSSRKWKWLTTRSELKKDFKKCFEFWKNQKQEHYNSLFESCNDDFDSFLKHFETELSSNLVKFQKDLFECLKFFIEQSLVKTVQILSKSNVLKTKCLIPNFNFRIFSFRCCCFFKRKKKKSPRQKWLDAQKSPEREAAVTLLRATSHSNSRDSCLNPSQDYIQASSQHNIRYPSASVLTSTPTNNTPTLPI